jgi:DNA invertase Pin-like site-specific DNA recombinase
MKKIRCAIYTRKSSEEGLDMEFNSLDAQRDACEAYIKSQKHEGWVLIPTQYNDGGFSGGNMERPAFKELLEDIKAEKIDIVVVYKVDRLTRSLMDFSKIIEVFDAHGASFVSITQQFNTTTSMGRLTLNMLLSFAQFERDMIVERTSEGKAIAKQNPDFKEGRPKKYSKRQLAHALELLENYSYKQVEEMTGISKSTLIRTKRTKLCNRNSKYVY